MCLRDRYAAEHPEAHAAKEELYANLLDRSVFSLSGGEKQKIACGSAAAVEPDVFVLDEPSSNLDAYYIADFRKLLKILKSQRKTIIIAEHRLYYLYDLADRIIYLSDGEIQGDYTCLLYTSRCV